jgi:hypothetical protein
MSERSEDDLADLLGSESDEDENNSDSEEKTTEPIELEQKPIAPPKKAKQKRGATEKVPKRDAQPQKKRKKGLRQNSS